MMFLYCSFRHRRSLALRALLFLYALLATPFALRGCVGWVDSVLGNDGSVLVVSADAGLDAVVVTLDGRELRPKPEFSQFGSLGVLVFPDVSAKSPKPLLRATWRMRGLERSAQAQIDWRNVSLCIIHLSINAEGEAVSPRWAREQPYAPFSMDCHFAF